MNDTDSEYNVNINDPANISGLHMFLNQEKISNSIDIADMEKRVKSMQLETESIFEAIEEDNLDPVQELELAYNDIDRDSNLPDDVMSVITELDNTINSLNRPISDTKIVYNSNDNYYNQQTQEESRQQNIKQVMDDVPNIDFNIEQEAQKEQKILLISQIESLREDLIDLGVSNIDKIPEVTYDASLQLIEEIHRRLHFKYNKIKFQAIAEEAMIAGSNLIEMMFNGRHEYFGAKPDATGWSSVVKSKMKRIKYETSTAVSHFVTHYNVNAVAVIAMELLPSLITQTQRNKNRIKVNDDLSSTFRQESMSHNINELNNLSNVYAS